MKRAARGRIARRGNVTAQNDAVSASPLARHSREQRFGVGVAWRAIEGGGRRELDDVTEVHDRDPIGDVADNAQIVGDEEISEIELVLEVGQQG